ncbi:hypothetical protein TrRE_jg10876, partial [Triparma retinervis]
QYGGENGKFGPTLVPPRKRRKDEPKKKRTKKKPVRKLISDFQKPVRSSLYKTSRGFTSSPPPDHFLGPPPPTFGGVNQESVDMLLKDMDWLSGSARPNLTKTGGAILASLPTLQPSAHRKKNRPNKLRDKKAAAKLSADVVALQTAMLLITEHGYGGGSGKL